MCYSRAMQHSLACQLLKLVIVLFLWTPYDDSRRHREEGQIRSWRTLANDEEMYLCPVGECVSSGEYEAKQFMPYAAFLQETKHSEIDLDELLDIDSDEKRAFHLKVL